MATKISPYMRADFREFTSIQTRWMDNDAYGHINNVQYYSYFDTVVNSHLINSGVLKIETSEVIGLVVETQCNYFSSLKFPQIIQAGLRVTKIGTSSVCYEIALFEDGANLAAAQGHFVHVYVERTTYQPVPLPDNLRNVVESLYINENEN